MTSCITNAQEQQSIVFLGQSQAFVTPHLPCDWVVHVRSHLPGRMGQSASPACEVDILVSIFQQLTYGLLLLPSWLTRRSSSFSSDTISSSEVNLRTTDNQITQSKREDGRGEVDLVFQERGLQLKDELTAERWMDCGNGTGVGVSCECMERMDDMTLMAVGAASGPERIKRITR